MAKLQVILDDGGNPAFAIIPWEEYRRWSSGSPEGELSDEELYDQAMAVEEESFPIEVADRLLAGENAVKVYRNYRGMTQRDLAEAAGINAVYLSQIERRKRTGSARTLAAIAGALGIGVDSLI